MIELCLLEHIPNHQSRGFKLGEDELFAVRHNRTVYVYRNRCPHLGIPLEWVPDRFLDTDGELIQCSTHGALFTIHDGFCVSGPCSGQSLQALECSVEGGVVRVRID
ncbi:Rieske (2Fe-2S) protein [Pseudomaricurvus alkylphenolicus]|uniref:Rieske (2Fe-2S) protein n=1 Tax=Pseudomaricurvus alkylphenolicus TaxID=1306991 RepID=UPI001420DC8F|nr:Rieske (2Fe-2S) protein [Pseudomaricurvus alkylphenolicus]NIB42906.1 Rieske (2Fe-2S) protein [Pseudomaricurvus alkylphenolicus]